MFYVLGWIFMVIAGIFLIAKRVAPESELLNSFEKTHSFRYTVITFLIAAGVMFIGNGVVFKNEEWREHALIQVEDRNGTIGIFQGEEQKAAIAYDNPPKEKEEYKTSLLVWDKYANLELSLKKKGEEQAVRIEASDSECSRYNEEAYSVPVTFYFEESGLWKIIVENDDEVIGEIVLEVKK
ncbi:hypothetical protein QTG56_17270 [Rossellomorea sp. AcN35-11]|nr:hypothetical protein [Rossellomorea aquimaris]WJV28775.1 hypothetical protein QTG56_17270 [Rossellomorea sp. AcN35-11]